MQKCIRQRKLREKSILWVTAVTAMLLINGQSRHTDVI